MSLFHFVFALFSAGFLVAMGAGALDWSPFSVAVHTFCLAVQSFSLGLRVRSA